MTVLNQGSAAAGASKLKIACQPLGGTGCPGGLDGTIDIQPLDPGQAGNEGMIIYCPSNWNVRRRIPIGLLFYCRFAAIRGCG
jgi:hypothetical protein